MEDGEEGPVNEFNFQAEQEEGGREYEPEGAWTQMPVDADPPPGDLHRGGASFSGEYHFPNTVGPKLSPFGSVQKPQLPPRTPFWDSCGTFRSTPYPVGDKRSSSISGTSFAPSSMSPPSSAAVLPRHSAPASRVSRGSTKGKTWSTLDQMKNDLRERLDDFDAGSQDQKLLSGVLRNEQYSMKMQAWMQGKEIMFLEAQQVTERAEAEAIHQRQLEVKKTNLELWKADAEILEKQSQVLMLQLFLAEFEKQRNHGHSADPSSLGADASSGSGYA
ncbi:hypothetical protein PAXRUDRAFT_20220 [Paxillus rubicundulus Ve08.2h10]|uniref:Uncharacterized protein n=1 Tax=Paxillus rubicundulus Ve08.2h10 TaxID=930991 RepID=A0A0D0CSY0_9AGAM|nr:hypothetical protein PAXRUDRAFT_20220 [Paxillus rubicundulus Ve08.2h10]